MFNDFPELGRAQLIEYGGGVTYRQAETLVRGKKITDLAWAKPLLTGVVDGMPCRFNLRSLTFVESQCACPVGRRGMVCEHVMALVLEVNRRNREEAVQALEEPKQEEVPLVVRSLVLSAERGIQLRLRLLLPPNWMTMVAKNRFMVKLEAVVVDEVKAPERLDRGLAYAMTEGDERAAALVESWHKGRLHGLMQLDGERLIELMTCLADSGEIYFADKLEEAVDVQGKDGLALLQVLRQAGQTGGKQGKQERVKPVRRERSGASLSADEGASRRMFVDGSSQYLVITSPSRESASYGPVIDLLQEYGFRLDATTRKWWLRDRHKVLNFLAREGEAIRSQWRAQLAEGFVQRTKKVKECKMVWQTKELADGVEWSVALQAGKASPHQLQQAVAAGRSYVEVGEQVYLISADLLARYQAAQQQVMGERSVALVSQAKRRLSQAEFLSCLAEGDWEEEAVSLSDSLRERLRRLRDHSELARAPWAKHWEDVLRPYQQLGVSWLWFLYENELGGVLADEMGLGKTVQSLAFLECVLAQEGCAGPCLVVCPAGLLENWFRECGQFLPGVRPYVHHGAKRVEEAVLLSAESLVLTTYGTLSQDVDLFSGVDWHVALIDEAQVIKNRKTLTATALRRLSAKVRVGLSGTPVENRWDDLRSIFAFLLPGLLPAVPKDTKGEDKAFLDELHCRRAAPYILRRSKVEVLPELPPVVEQVLYCSWPEKQKRLYGDWLHETQAAIDAYEKKPSGGGRSKKGSGALAVLQQLLRLRQVCSDPRVLDEGFAASDCAKAVLLKEQLLALQASGRKALVFSQFVQVLKHVRADVEALGMRAYQLDGSTKNREALCRQFNEDAQATVFFISLKAGGVGLNITSADTVFFMDPWWNPAVESQAVSRAHRMGQRHTVTSVKLVMGDSIEEKVMALQEEKAGLLEAVFASSAAAQESLSMKDVLQLL